MSRFLTRAVSSVIIVILGIVTVVTAQEQTIVPKEKRATVAEIKRLLAATNALATGKEIVTSVLDGLSTALPEVPDSVWKELRVSVDWNEITDSLIPIYRRQFDQKEIKKLTKFYESDLGKKFVAAQPTLIKESMDICESIALDFEKRMTAKLAEKGYRSQSDVH